MVAFLVLLTAHLAQRWPLVLSLRCGSILRPKEPFTLDHWPKLFSGDKKGLKSFVQSPLR